MTVSDTLAEFFDGLAHDEGHALISITLLRELQDRCEEILHDMRDFDDRHA
ncbi:hypothetical protein ABZ865_41160 [Streptomyces sp. NPDC047085]|uniref:hypothetical protein n=1 Tax=Streptomyces sp. NPDC047085 TaxID=3155140 RepID=UPI0033EA63C0